MGHIKISLYEWIINLFLLQILGLNGNVTGGMIGGAWALGLEYWIGTIYFPFVYFLKKKFDKGLIFISIMTYIISIGILRHYSTNFIAAKIFDILMFR